MDYEEFKDAVLQEMQAQYEDLRFGITHVEKLQGLSYDALSVGQEGSNVSAMIDLDKAFAYYQECDDFGETLSNLANAVDNGMEKMPQIDFSMLDDYDSVKEQLEVQMIPVKGNEDQLSRLPHRVTGDIAMIYRIELDQMQDRTSSTLVTNDMLKAYGITEEQLFTDAMVYAPRNRSAVFKSLPEMLNELSGGSFPEDMDSPFYVATVEDKEQGAGVIMYPGFLEMASEKLGGDLFILPSSVHEVLVLKDEQELNTADFNDMIATINASVVEPKDRLSDHAYHYDSELHVLELATDYDERMTQVGVISEDIPDVYDSQKETISCLLVRPGLYPERIEISTELEDLQKAVGGYIEVSYPFEDEVGIICNEEGKISGLPYNRALRSENGRIYDILAGDFLVVGLTEDDEFGSLTPEQMDRYEETFHQPETFVRMGRSIMSVPIPDEEVREKEVTEHAGRSRGPDR